MSDVPFCSSENACTEGGEQTNGCEPVCINVSRIYDSCGAKDCLSNLPVMFTEANQKIIDGACSVKISNVRIITSTVEVEPVAFHRGFYSVDMMYYFAVTVEAYTAAGAIPETVTGLAMYGKRVVLYGGEGCVKSFSSDKDVVCDTSDSDCPCKYPYCLPRATVQISNPMARNANGEVIMYADCVTPSMEKAITETLRRRTLQQKYNEEHGITPQTIKKSVRDVLEITSKEKVDGRSKKRLSKKEREALIQKLTAEMKEAAKLLEFEHAAYLRDKINELKEK